MKLKVIAFVTILVYRVIGVSLPLFSRYMPSLAPDRDLFTIVKTFASGVILATGNPWKKFPFMTFVAMLSALFTLMVDSFAMGVYKKRSSRANNGARQENGNKTIENSEHGHGAE
ncbi:Detected protein of confused Function [Hibiscus syriacus]|uniref:Detected protein of confused Function n=1 Tax=Hibiscus syriacus TaxID=106335 RepID=A0A6A3CKX2_HIBSY|nr:Detected protein of confused Function [Hibiscus syriacus]